MDYIVNVRAKLFGGGENLKTEYLTVKKWIEKEHIKVHADLATDSLSLKKIQEQLNNQKLTLNIGNVTFDQSGVNKANEAVGNIEHKFQNINNEAKSVGATIKEIFNEVSYKNALSGLGFSDEYIGRVTSQLKNFELAIDKINVKRSVTGEGDEAQKTVTALISATDKYGRLITLSQTLDNNEKEIQTNTLSITDNIKKQAQEQEKVNKAYAQQKDALNSAVSAAKELYAVQHDRKNPIAGSNMAMPTESFGVSKIFVENIEKLGETAPKTKAFVDIFNQWVDVIRRANTELENTGKISNNTLSELKTFKDDVRTASVSAMTERQTAASFRPKDVTAEIEKAKIELNIFEQELAKVGKTLDDVRYKEGDTFKTLREGVNSASSSTDLEKYLDQLGIAKAKLKEWKQELANSNQVQKQQTQAVVTASNLDQLKNDWRDLSQRVKEYGINIKEADEVLGREAYQNLKSNMGSMKELLSRDTLNSEDYKRAKAYYDSVKSSIERIIDVKNKNAQADKNEQSQYDKLLQERIKNEKEILELEKQIASFDRVGNKTKTPERDQAELLHLQATQRREDLAKEAESILGVEKAQEQLNSVRIATQNLRDRNDYWKASIQEENQVIEAERQKQSILDRQDEIYQKQLAIRNEIYQTTLAYNKETQSVLGRDSEESQRLAQKLEELHRQEVEINSIAQKELSIDAVIENQNRLREETRANLEQILQLENRINDASRANAIIQSEKMLDSVGKTNNKYTNDTSNSVLSNAENIKRLSAEYDKVIEKINAFKNSSKDTFESTKQSAQSAIVGFNQLAESLKNNERQIVQSDEAIQKLKQDTSKGVFANNANDPNVAKLKQDIDGLRNTYTQLQSQFQSQGSTTQVTQGFATLDERIKSVSQRATELQQNLSQTNAELTLTGQKNNLNNRIETWLKNNTKASGSTVQALKQLQAQIQSADKASLKDLNQQFKDITRNAELAGEAGKSAIDRINEKVGKFSSWFGVSQFIMNALNEGKQAIVTLKEVDTILTEISKTSERSAESLAELGESAFDAASKYGVSVQNYLTGVQEMARAGYETMGEGQSEKMAELALLAQAAGDVTDSVARDYLIATDAAYQLGGSIEKLQTILDGQNKVNIKCPHIQKCMCA